MKIPDDVYEGRCRYCIQYTGEENGEIPDEKVFVPYYSRKDRPEGVDGPECVACTRGQNWEWNGGAEMR